MINQIAKTGICNFVCHMCELDPMCRDYNHRGNDNIEADQVEIRKQFAADYLNNGTIPFDVLAKNQREG